MFVVDFTTDCTKIDILYDYVDTITVLQSSKGLS